ncbi:MAG TPA: quinone oxidoreductase [Acidobacteriota bacterium]|nr:quinone oxidoreductase [Acidobacteriota bacterium]
MKAIQIEQTGGPDVLQYKDVNRPSIAADEILIRVEAAGINFIDTYHRRGLYPVKLPFIPGVEGAGTVVEKGSDVTEFAEGDPVAYCTNLGSYAEFVAIPAWKAVAIPEGVSTETGAAVMLQGMTAHYLCTDTFPLQSGKTALIHAAAGGVGLLLVQLARLRGARVIGTVSTEEKAELARQAGADNVILYTREDFEQRVRELTDGRGVDVVYESVGKSTFEKSLNCLKPRGYLVLFGQSSGPVEPLDPQVLNSKGSLFLTRPSLNHYMADRTEVLRRAGELLELVETGKLAVRIGEKFPLQEAAEAHRRLEARKTTGKVLLIP